MGEGGWSALEIIIVLILVLALLSRVFGTGPGTVKVPDIATYKPDSQSVPSFNNCGKVLVTRPKSLEKVAISVSGIAVQATVTTCNTIEVQPDSFTAVIVDAKGVPVSKTVKIPVQGNKDVWALNSFVELSALPSTGTGYVIITRISNTGAQVADAGARIPVRFVNQ